MVIAARRHASRADLVKPGEVGANCVHVFGALKLIASRAQQVV